MRGKTQTRIQHSIQREELQWGRAFVRGKTARHQVGKVLLSNGISDLSVGQHSLHVLAFSLQVGESLHTLDQDLYQH